MSHIMKFTEWQDPIGYWHTGDINGLPQGSNYWYNVPRMLEMSLTDFILLLKNEYHITKFLFDEKSGFLTWRWNNYNDCHRYTLFVNREAKKRNFYVGG